MAFQATGKDCMAINLYKVITGCLCVLNIILMTIAWIAVQITRMVLVVRGILIIIEGTNTPGNAGEIIIAIGLLMVLVAVNFNTKAFFRKLYTS